jgi:hemicentin
MFSVPPEIDKDAASNVNLSVIAGQSIAIDCPVSGVPPPAVKWFKDDVIIKPMESVNMKILFNGRRLELTDAEVYDAGRYKCRADNVAGSVERNYQLHVLGTAIIYIFSYVSINLSMT